MSTGPAPATHLPRTGDFRWVKLWGLPIRATHWTAAISIVVLAVTGMYIGKPYFITTGEASSHYLMGTVRFVHFVAAALLVTTAMLRIYGLFQGNQYEHWTALVPHRARDLRNLFQQARAYLLVRPEAAPPYLGHNPLQQLSYTSLYAVASAQVLTGFALYGQYNQGGVFYRAFNWIGALVGGMPNVRFLHHEITWVFVIYLPIHVYLSVRADILEHDSTISSIISGGRMIHADAKFEDD